MNSLIKTAVCSAIAGMFLAACGGGGGGSADAGSSGSGSGSGSGTGGPVTPPVVTAQAEMLSPETGGAAYLDGQGSAARFYHLKDFATDSKGNIYAADGSTIRKITPDGTVSTFAGQPHEFEHRDGVGVDARFQGALSVVVDSQDNILVHDFFSVRKITPAGVVSTFASLPVADSPNMYSFYDDRSEVRPTNMIIDSKDNLYIFDQDKRRLLQVNTTGQVGEYISRSTPINETNGKVLGGVLHLSIDKKDNIYMIDWGNDICVRVGTDKVLHAYINNCRTIPGAYFTVDPEGNIIVSQGTYLNKRSVNGSNVDISGVSYEVGVSTDGTKSTARLQVTGALSYAANGDLLFADEHSIRKLTKDGSVSTIAGKNIYIDRINPASPNRNDLRRVTGVVAGPDQSVYVADGINETIYQLNTSTKSMTAFSNYLSWGYRQSPIGEMFVEMQLDKNGNLLFNQGNNNQIFSMDSKGKVTTLTQNTGKSNEPDLLRDFIVLPSGKLVINDQYKLLKTRNTDGSYKLLAGTLNIFWQADGYGGGAGFTKILDMAADSKDNLYVVEDDRSVIRKVAPDGQVSLYAGSYTRKAHKDGMRADAAFKCPRGIVSDGQDNLYVADPCDNAIRKIGADGRVSTLDIQWKNSSGATSRALPAPRRVFWVNGSLYVFAGGDIWEQGGTLFRVPLN